MTKVPQRHRTRPGMSIALKPSTLSQERSPHAVPVLKERAGGGEGRRAPPTTLVMPESTAPPPWNASVKDEAHPFPCRADRCVNYKYRGVCPVSRHFPQSFHDSSANMVWYAAGSAAASHGAATARAKIGEPITSTRTRFHFTADMFEEISSATLKRAARARRGERRAAERQSDQQLVRSLGMGDVPPEGWQPQKQVQPGTPPRPTEGPATAAHARDVGHRRTALEASARKRQATLGAQLGVSAEEFRRLPYLTQIQFREVYEPLDGGRYDHTGTAKWNSSSQLCRSRENYFYKSHDDENGYTCGVRHTTSQPRRHASVKRKQLHEVPPALDHEGEAIPSPQAVPLPALITSTEQCRAGGTERQAAAVAHVPPTYRSPADRVADDNARRRALRERAAQRARWTPLSMYLDADGTMPVFTMSNKHAWVAERPDVAAARFAASLAMEKELLSEPAEAQGHQP